MNKKKKIIISVGIVACIVIALLLFQLSNYSNDKTNSLCENIKDTENNKNNFITFIGEKNSNPSSNEIIKEVKERNKDLKVILVPHSNVKKECFKEILIEAGVYDVVKDSDSSIAILYKDGKYIGAHIDVNDYQQFKDYLLEKGIIKQKKESESYTAFIEDIKNEYLFFLIGLDKQDEIVSKNASKVFKETNYDIINVTDKEGKKIFNYLSKEYKVDAIFPQVVYMKNSKLIKSAEVFATEAYYQEFKNSIQ